MDVLKNDVLSRIDEERGALAGLADALHQHPEVGFQEQYAVSLLTSFLKGQGFSVQVPYGGLDTAFRADMGADRPTVAILAEYDALPEVGHGCGHNLIAAGAVGAALGAAAVISQLDGSISVIGTPAEEVLYEEPGKVRLLKAGAFEDIDAALMFHPWTDSGLSGPGLALVGQDVAFHGRPAHAAADPWHGVNALDGVILTFNAINALRQQVRPDARIHGIITHGGDVPNIIPAFASARFVARSADQGYLLEELVPKLENCARGAGLAAGAEVSIARTAVINTTQTNPVLDAILEEAARTCGFSFVTRVDSGASTDFGNVSQSLPATCFYMDIDLPEGAAWHSPDVARAAGSPSGRRAMLEAARIMALTVVQLLSQPALIQEAYAVFRQGKE